MTWSQRVAEALGPIGRSRALGGHAWRVTAGGREVVVKIGEAVHDEAAGLRYLAAVAGAPPVPEVLLVESGLLVTTWIDPSDRTPAHEEDLGRRLATLHAEPWPTWGGGSAWIGNCEVDPAPAIAAADFYGPRLVELADRCGLADPVGRVAGRWDDLVPPSRPALLHGDLWWGNVLRGRDGRAWLIDPSVHGGHPEEDLAMLALFGGVPGRLVRAYEEARPLDAGWRDRVDLWQLYPLLVHAVLFGGGYRDQAAAIALRFGSA